MRDELPQPQRRTFLNTSLAMVAGGAGMALAGAAQAQAPASAPTRPMVVGHPRRNGVAIERVAFPNTSAQTVIAANLFTPARFDAAKKYPAIVIGHPFGGVKEQTAGLHAQKLAELGYVTLAFDASHYGDSSGLPRYTEVPGTRVGDYSACVDFFSNHPAVDPARIGVLGICGGGGYAVSAAQVDHRIQAIATVSMYDMGRARRQGLGDTLTYEQRMKTLDEVGEQRTREARGEPRRDIRALPESAGPDAPEIVREFLDYYATPRGQHPHSTSLYALTSLAPMMNFFPFAQIETIAPRPLLMIVGERAPSAYFSEDAYARAAQPKELFVVPGASHVDLYDRPPYIAQSLARLDAFFRQHLGA
ncbi:alpha/beta hydrolase [Janthinobacterium kumbetense]|uniref:Alpha/beta hydrolase n=1 Tax=Janthinobacterium kumbetense TaxID=2950280 RepID=A0ABT0WQM2_9BURK|nr:alpha/beta hydrolase [Janthinobacterium kumbetense]MCM2565216.1 alpha/beta hydrolase [Janthinobacterium kumbetense]